MCGIAGLLRMGKQPINPLHLKQLAVRIQHRGMDATGLALQDESGEIFVHKAQKQAWAFVTGDDFKNFINERLTENTVAAILHTRAWTVGPPHVHENNHPMFSGKAAVVHNGFISNHSALFDSMKLERGAETDSDIIRAIIDEHGISHEALKELNRMSGGAAIAALHPEYPGKILLGRSGNPLIVGATEDFFAFASTKDAIYHALRPWVKRFGIAMQLFKTQISYVPMALNTAWFFDNKKGLMWHAPFDVRGYGGAEISRDYRAHENWKNNHSRAEEATKRDTDKKPLVTPPPKKVDTISANPEWVACCNSDCALNKLSEHPRLMQLSMTQMYTPLSKMFCTYCGTWLDGNGKSADWNGKTPED